MSQTLRSLKNESQTVLANLREWAGMCGLNLVFDSATKKVHMVSDPGDSNGVEIRVGKNAKGIEREVDYSNIITRLYVYGKDDLQINEVNPTGLPYIDNFDWYIQQEGITSQEIYSDILANGKASRHLSEAEVRLNNYTDVQTLYADGVKILAKAAKPKVSYRAPVLDLSTLSGYKHEAFEVGDTLRVIDEELGINTLQYVIRKKHYPKEPWRDEAELENKILSIADTSVKTARAVEIIDRRGPRYEDSADKVLANWEVWNRAQTLREDGLIPMENLRGVWEAANSAIRAGRNQSVAIDQNGLTISENQVVSDNSLNGAIGTMAFGSQAISDDTGDYKLIWKTQRYIRATGGAIVLCAGEGLPIKTAVTPDGILAPLIIIDDDNPLSPDGNAVIIDEAGITTLYGQDEAKYIRIGSGEIKSWNFSAVNKTGFKISAETGIIQAYGIQGSGFISVGDVIDAGENIISTDGDTAKTGTRIVIDSTGIWGYRNNVLKFGFDLVGGGVTMSGYLDINDTLNMGYNPLSTDGMFDHSGNRLFITSTGIYGYYNNVEMFYFNVTTGSARFNGEVLVSKLQGGTVTGETFILDAGGVIKSADFNNNPGQYAGFEIDGGLGRIIINEAIVRGTVYAESGSFSGTVFASSGEFKGLVKCGTTTNYVLIDPSTKALQVVKDSVVQLEFGSNIGGLKLYTLNGLANHSLTCLSNGLETDGDFSADGDISAGDTLEAYNKAFVQGGYEVVWASDPYEDYNIWPGDTQLNYWNGETYLGGVYNDF